MTTTTSLTLADFLKLPEQKPALEFADGTITSKMSPNSEHGMVVLRCTELLRPFGLPLPEVRNTDDQRSYVPDVGLYYQRPAVPYPLELPELAIEVVSPGQVLGDLRAKCRWYVEHGSTQALLLDPARHVAEVFGPGVYTSQHHGAEPLPLKPALGFAGRLPSAADFFSLLDG